MYISKDSHPEQAFHCKSIPVGIEAQGGGIELDSTETSSWNKILTTLNCDLAFFSKSCFSEILQIFIEYLLCYQLLFCDTKMKKRIQFLPSRNLDPNSIVKDNYFESWFPFTKDFDILVLTSLQNTRHSPPLDGGLIVDLCTTFY